MQGVPCLIKQHRGKVKYGEIWESGMPLREGDQLSQFPWDRGVFSRLKSFSARSMNSQANQDELVTLS